MKRLLFILLISFTCQGLDAQNIGIGTTTPQGKLHIKGSADTSQLVIDANALQSNLQPLIRLRNSSGIDFMHIHSDNISSTFVGLNAGRVNNAGFGGEGNTFIGSGSGYANTSGRYNTTNGYHALYSSTLGSNNPAMVQ